MGGKNGNKTQPDQGVVAEFLAGQPEDRRMDCLTLIEMMGKETGEPPVMWGGSMVGFGIDHYCYPSGREGEIFKMGFSPRKAAFSIYLTRDLSGMAEHLARLGKHKQGKGCLYVKMLADVDLEVLREMIHCAMKTYRQPKGG
jgi:hypothetical protein